MSAAEVLELADDHTPAVAQSCAYCGALRVPLHRGTPPPTSADEAWRIPLCVYVPETRDGSEDWWLWCRTKGRLHLSMVVHDMDRRRETRPVAFERRQGST